MLSSTHFLFRATPPPRDVKPGEAFRIDDLALASRLSFLLWSQGPDETLRKVAAAGRLRDPAELDAQVDRMLADPRADSVVTNFAFQWLNLGRMDDIIPDPLLYPDFDRDLREGFREEMRLFVDSVLRGDRSVLELLSADYTFLNERLALQYGIRDVRGRALPQGAAGRSEPLRSARQGRTADGDVVRRSHFAGAAWRLDPRDVERHAADRAAAGCRDAEGSGSGHEDADRARTARGASRRRPRATGATASSIRSGSRSRTYDVDRQPGAIATSMPALPSMHAASSPTAARSRARPSCASALLGRPDQFVQALTEKLMMFALGRAVEYHDMPVVRAIVRDAAKKDYRFAELVKGVVHCAAFQQQRLPADAPRRSSRRMNGAGH